MTVVDPDWPHGRSMFTEPPRPSRDKQRVLKRIEDVIATINFPTKHLVTVDAALIYDRLPILMEACGDDVPPFDELVRRAFVRLATQQVRQQEAVDRGDVEFVV